MAKIITDLLNKRRNRTSADCEDSISSPEHKKTRTMKKLSEEDEIWMALNMSETVARKLEEILKKLQKLDVKEASVKNIEVKLKTLKSAQTFWRRILRISKTMRTSQAPR